MTTAAPTMRIGELAARTGVSTHVLRVWERRYGLLTPTRSAGGYRLYGPQDEWRVRTTARLRDEGMSAAQAAATALQSSRTLPDGTGEGGTQDVAGLRGQLLEAIERFDGTAAQAALDTGLTHLGVETAITDLVLPVLRETGDRWESGEFTVAQEHFASNLVRSRLATYSLAWDSGTGPLAVLACPAEELHDLGLLCFGVVLGRAGWRVRYLGADTPLVTLASAVLALTPDLVTLSAVDEEPLRGAAAGLDELSEDAAAALAATHVGVGGAGASAEIAGLLGGTHLDGDPVDAARRLVTDRLADGDGA